MGRRFLEALFQATRPRRWWRFCRRLTSSAPGLRLNCSALCGAGSPCLSNVPVVNRILRFFEKKIALIKLTFCSLFYNSFTNSALIMDTAMDPVMFLGENFSRVFGPVFFLIVIFMIVTVAAVFYICLLPHVWNDSKWWTSVHLLFGHFILVNSLFHYYKASFTDPGSVPHSEERVLPEVVSICKKCIAPKPPRTHHCSICKRCVLKMDHHCPWLNNCVGFYNHHHFLLFTIWIWIGAIYISLVGYDRFKEHYFGTKYTIRAPGLLSLSHLVTEVVGDIKISKKIVGDFDRKSWLDKGHEPSATWLRVIGRETTTFPNGTEAVVRPLIAMNEAHFHNLVIYEFMVSAAVSVVMIGLIGWHAYLITKGETSIEVHINKKERNRMKSLNLVYKNPYDFGPLQNWRIFFGINDHGRGWLHVIFPSNHRPDGDGLTFRTNAASSRGAAIKLRDKDDGAVQLC